MLVHSDHQDLQERPEELDLPDFQESRDWMDQAVVMEHVDQPDHQENKEDVVHLDPSVFQVFQEFEVTME